MTIENIEPGTPPEQAADTTAETHPPPPPQGEERVAALEAELAQMKDQMLRALAEADNIRKRALKEREDAQKFAITAFARDMLDIADNFRRAMDAIPAEAKTGDDPLMKTLLEGIDAVERNMLRIFERHGIKKIEPLDQMFDPNFHEVMFEAPMPGKPAGTVIQLVEPGYTLNDRLLRPARVGVAKDDGSTPTTHVDQTA
jgi:molecular chaperone GrpE